MDRERKLELMMRVLGLKHKLKVHESMRAPDTHEELALHQLARWEFEDEIRAIEEILEDTRRISVAEKRAVVEQTRASKKKKSK